MISQAYQNPTAFNIGDMIQYCVNPVYETEYFIVLGFQYGAAKLYNIHDQRIVSISIPFIQRSMQFFKRLS